MPVKPTPSISVISILKHGASINVSDALCSQGLDTHPHALSLLSGFGDRCEVLIYYLQFVIILVTMINHVFNHTLKINKHREK